MSSKAIRRESLRRSRLLGGALVTLMCVPALAGPEGEQVVAGSAKFRRVGNRTVIRATDGAIINYSSFDIAANERVRFIQPGANARVLNRIRSNEPTRIDGTLRSNGRVYMVNRAGVLFGADSIINVGALHAAAGNITNKDFLSGVDRFTLTGDLTNMGTITADHVMLAGQTVSNLGTIVANEGFVAMIAGDHVLVGERGGHMFAKIDSKRIEALDYAAQISGVTNAGAILATDGQVIVGAGDFYGIVTHTSTNIVTHNLVIESGDGGITRVAGNIDVSGGANGRDVGGSARILGDRVAVDNARIDATGALGGGEILIGGEFQGSGPIRNAKRTFVGSNAILDASAIDNGDGGRIIVWADELTGFAGDLIATGGEFGGDGGFGEISGKHGLIFQGSVNLLAANGQQGTILFDPDNINIIDGAGGADDGELGDNQILGGDGGAVDFEISEQALEALVGSVILQANDNITVADLADNDLGFQATGGQSVEITADFDGNGTGTFSMAAGDTISTQGGDLNLRASEFRPGGIQTAGGNVTIEPASGGGALILLDEGASWTVDTSGPGPGGDITISADIDVAPGGASPIGSVDLNAGTGTATLSAVRSTDDLVVTADEIDLTAEIRVARVTLRPSTPEWAIQIAGGPPSAERLDLEASELAMIRNGTELISIGGQESTGVVTLNDAEFFDPIRLITRGEVVIAGDVVGRSNASFEIQAPAGLTRLDGSITTNESQVRIESDILVTGDSSIDTDGGVGETIVILGSIDGPGSLILDATSPQGGIGGAGRVRIEGDIGMTTPLSALTVEGFEIALTGNVGTEGASGVTGQLAFTARDENIFRSSLLHAGGLSLDALSGTVLISGENTTIIASDDAGVRILGGDLKVAEGIDLSILSEGSITFDSGIRLQGAGASNTELTLVAPAGTITFGGRVGDPDSGDLRPRSVHLDARSLDIRSVNTLKDQTYTASDITLRDDLRIFGDGVLTLGASDPSRLNIPEDIRIDAAGRVEGGEIIRLNAAIVSARDLTIAIGDAASGRTGDLFVRDLGTSQKSHVSPIGDLVIEQVGDVHFAGNVFTTSIDIKRADQVFFDHRVRTMDGPFRFLGGSLTFAEGIRANAGEDLEALNITASEIFLLDRSLLTNGNATIRVADVFRVAPGANLIFGGNLNQQGGRVELGTGKIHAPGQRLTFGSTLVLGRDTTIVADTLRLNRSVLTDGTRRSLTLRVENRADLNGPIGGNQPLQRLAVVGTGPGHVVTIRDRIKTRNGQVYKAVTTLGAEARLRTTRPGAPITFHRGFSTADADSRIRINSRGVLRFLGPVRIDTPTIIDADGLIRFRRPVTINASTLLTPEAGLSFDRLVTIDKRLRVRARNGGDGSDVTFGGRIISLNGQGELDLLIDADPTAKGFNLPSNASGSGAFSLQRARRNATEMPRIWIRGDIGVNRQGSARPLASVSLNAVRPKANGVPRGTRAINGASEFESARLPASATILLGPMSPRTVGKRVPELTIRATKLVTGFHEVLTSNANVSIFADKLTLADTNILGSLQIGPLNNQLQRLNLLARPSSQVLTSNGVETDDSAAIVIGGIERDGDSDRFRSEALTLGPFSEGHLNATGSGVVSLGSAGPADPRFTISLPDGAGGIVGDAQGAEILDDFISFERLFGGFQRSMMQLTIDGEQVPADLGGSW